MKTYSPKPDDITRVWYITDATTAPLGRIATQIAELLMGKGKVNYAPHLDCGDYVIVLNSDKLVVTGDKETAKKYYRYSGYPSGLKTRSLAEQRELDSTEIIRHAVRGMLPKNKLLDGRLARLKVYSGSEHPHEPQKPTKIEIGVRK